MMTDHDHFVPVAPQWWAGNFGGMVVFGVVAARSRSKLLRTGFALAVTTHVIEAAYAYGAARRAGFVGSANRWALQTLAVGFPSLLALRDARNDDDVSWDDPYPVPASRPS
jgi:Domain of unknown function (DUF4499)